MLRKAFKVIGIAVLGAVFALGALAVSVVYIIPGMLAHEPEQKIALNSISCPPGMIENMGTGRCTTSEESMTRVTFQIAALSHPVGRPGTSDTIRWICARNRQGHGYQPALGRRLGPRHRSPRQHLR